MSFSTCKSFIAFSYDITMGRIYKQNGEYIVMTVNNISIAPYGSKSLSETADYIYNLCSQSSSAVDYNIHYNKQTSKKKKTKLFNVIQETELTKKFIITSLLYV